MSCCPMLLPESPSRNIRWLSAYRVSWTREDFPQPETPVTQVSFPSGMSTSMPLRLCSLAPLT